jgi:hypothetical protein
LQKRRWCWGRLSAAATVDRPAPSCPTEAVDALKKFIEADRQRREGYVEELLEEFQPDCDLFPRMAASGELFDFVRDLLANHVEALSGGVHKCAEGLGVDADRVTRAARRWVVARLTTMARCGALPTDHVYTDSSEEEEDKEEEGEAAADPAPSAKPQTNPAPEQAEPALGSEQHQVEPGSGEDEELEQGSQQQQQQQQQQPSASDDGEPPPPPPVVSGRRAAAAADKLLKGLSRTSKAALVAPSSSAASASGAAARRPTTKAVTVTAAQPARRRPVVGQQVSVEFKGDGWYVGKVVEWQGRHKFRVHFSESDDTKFWLDSRKNEWRVKRPRCTFPAGLERPPHMACTSRYGGFLDGEDSGRSGEEPGMVSRVCGKLAWLRPRHTTSIWGRLAEQEAVE